jgi:hypothetical protein
MSLRIKITEFGDKTESEAQQNLLDCKYIVCYKGDRSQETIVCKTKTELFKQLEDDNENIDVVLELYAGSISDDGYVSFLTKQFKQDN